MALRRYRHNLRNHISGGSSIYINTSNSSSNSVTIFTSTGRLKIKDIQTAICNIINSITIRMEIDQIMTIATNLRSQVKTQSDLLKLVIQIENLVSTVFSNQPTAITAILQIIQRLKDDINQYEPSCCANYLDSSIFDKLNIILTMISDAINATAIQTGMESIYGEIHKTVMNEEYIRRAEEAVMGIFQNIADKVDFGIIKQRISYVQDLVSKINKDCMLYNSVLSLEIYGIVDMFVTVTNDNFKTELDKIQIRIQALYNKLYKTTECLRLIKEAETLVLSIIQNIIDRVSFDIVTRRLTYLQGLLTAAANF